MLNVTLVKQNVKQILTNVFVKNKYKIKFRNALKTSLHTEPGIKSLQKILKTAIKYSM